MKKNLFLRLCLILMVAITAYSCRTDQFPEQETFNNSAKFQLTSKRISLNEAKHKEKLITELSKVETKFKALSKTNVNGRVIDYGNGVSIDTDDVIYTENGPNYHNYTFYIKRENAPADAPLENLVLTPMTNGLYKELLISYNLTAQEKQTMVNGGFVDTKGKVTIIELAQGTYNNGSLTSRSSCGWDYSLQYTICDGNDHHSNGELPSSEGGPCRANNPSVPVLVAVYKCYEIEYNGPNGNDWWAGPGGGNGGGGGSQEPGGNDPNTNPCNGNGATTSPTDPNTNIGEGGCSGIPAPINLPPVNRSCGRLSQTTTNSKFSSSLTSLKGKTSLFRETGYTLSDPIAGSNQTGTQDTFLDSPVGSKKVRFTFNPNTFAFMHVHFDDLKDPIFSPGDVIEFNKWLVWAQNWNSIPTNMPKIDLKRLSYTVVTSLGVYTMTFDGTDVVPFTNYDIDIINNKYLEKLGSAATQSFNGETNFDMDKLEEEFLRFVKEYLPMPGMKLYKIENSGNYEIFLKPNNKRDIAPCN